MRPTIEQAIEAARSYDREHMLYSDDPLTDAELNTLAISAQIDPDEFRSIRSIPHIGVIVVGRSLFISLLRDAYRLWDCPDPC